MHILKFKAKRLTFLPLKFSVMSPRTSLLWKREGRHLVTISPKKTRSLSSLPTEMLLEIVSHVPAPSIPFANYGPPDVSSMERKQLLLNLTQVCRSLRYALLPILWETVEACTVKGASVFATNIDPKWWRLVANRLSKQLQVVTNIRPDWAPYIRTVNVTITPFNADMLVPELARCLALMPNLRTIQITTLWWINGARVKGQNGYYTYSDSLFENTFTGYTFPSVQYVALPTAAVSLLACFPEVRSVFQGDAFRPDSDVAKFVEKIADHCPKVEYFAWATGAYCMTKISDLEMFFYSQANLHAPAFLTVVDRLTNLRRVQLYTMYHNTVGL
ncbi:hypothetical protein M378DRAFT_10642 [Amanita muscaria Koide BX008]|uniref:F-box domain-containing protein n=1 Tax=Amanita muscaria (strain Koide BX008) TaxID=946122 RepID=A0A0C2WVK1_AMAMK|nr:hypothetical protein M378DRAFT_10642 [Amanita muscaria Koide BX008]